MCLGIICIIRLSNIIMHWYKLEKPHFDSKEKVPLCTNFWYIESFLWTNYAPSKLTNWKEFVLHTSDLNKEFSDFSSMTMKEYIETTLSGYNDYSFATIEHMSDSERYTFMDFLSSIHFPKLKEYLWSYIFLIIILWSYSFDFREWQRNYILQYIKKYPETVYNIPLDSLDMIREAAHRLWYHETSFGLKVKLFYLYAMLVNSKYDDVYASVLEKYKSSIDKSFFQDLTIQVLPPRWKSPHDYSHYHALENKDIHKNESQLDSVYIDAPVSLWLFYKWTPIAVVSGMLWSDNDFVIYQMQAVSQNLYTGSWVYKGKRVKEITKYIPWQDILHETICSVVKQSAINHIYIQPGDKNHWTKELLEHPVRDDLTKNFIKQRTNIPHLSQKNAQKIYDIFADKHWYKKNNTWFWHYKDSSLS